MNEPIGIRTGTPAPRRTPVPGWLVWLVLGGVMLVVAVIAVGALLIWGGATAPPVNGAITWQAAGWPPEMRLDAEEAAWIAAPAQAAIPARPFTLVVRATLTDGSDAAAGWGVWLDAPDGTRVLYAISGEGYTTTRRCPDGTDPAVIETCPALRPEWRWMAYNRLKPPGQTNSIALHVEDAATGTIRLRLNDERLGAAAVTWSGVWGVWVRGGRSSPARLAAAEATLYADTARGRE